MDELSAIVRFYAVERSFDLDDPRLVQLQQAIAGRRVVRLHDLRHTFATLLGALGVAKSVIGALLGHVPSNITQHYARATLSAMREAVELLEAHYDQGGAKAKG